ncbi:hypothetical protein [Moraxella caviae]|uniref:hypothetical protein n=1 Tax=Moraxella caviae TaxID=34060 RepID=UPI00117C2BDB|nr:hypothetical protein [Moraxella caviae]
MAFIVVFVVKSSPIDDLSLMALIYRLVLAEFILAKFVLFVLVALAILKPTFKSITPLQSAKTNPIYQAAKRFCIF